MWHDSNHVQDTRFKGISRKDAKMLNRIELVSDLLWRHFLDSLSEIFADVRHMNLYAKSLPYDVITPKLRTARCRILHRAYLLPTSLQLLYRRQQDNINADDGVHSPISLSAMGVLGVWLCLGSSHLLLLTNPNPCVNLFPCLFS